MQSDPTFVEYRCGVGMSVVRNKSCDKWRRSTAFWYLHSEDLIPCATG